MRILVERDIAVPMRDGVSLATDVWRTDCAERLPTLVMRHPYSKDDATLLTLAVNVHALVREGYAVVIQDSRGRFSSEGRFVPFDDEANDGEDTVAWAVAQPWSSGRIGLLGESYSGFAQWQTATRHPAGLAAIAPTQTWADSYGGFVYRGGAFQLGGILNWAALYVGLAEWERSHSENSAVFESLLDSVDRPQESFFAPLSTRHDLKIVAPFLADWRNHTANDAWWKSPQRLTRFEDVTVPALIIGGWNDVFADATVDTFIGIRTRGGSDRARDLSRLVMGPWAHSMYSAEFPEKSYGLLASAAGFDLTGLHLRWFDALLRDRENGLEAEPRVSLFVEGVDEWRHYEDWPPPGVRERNLKLSSSGSANTASGDGTLVADDPVHQVVDRFTYDPSEPVPTHGGRNMLPGLSVCANTGPRDQGAVESRDDVLCYTGAVLGSDLTVIGLVRVDLTVSSDRLDTDVTAKLVDLGPDGRAEGVADGVLRLRFRDGDVPAPMDPGTQYRVSVDIGNVARVFGAGHRIRLEVSSSNFPRFDRNPNTGSFDESDSNSPLIAHNAIHHLPDSPNLLVLPVLDS